MLKQDIAAVAAIEKEGPLPWSDINIRSTYRSRHTSSWVVEDDGVIGYAIVTSDWMISSVLRFRVAEAHRGLGAGAALLQVVVNATGDDCSIEAAIDEKESGAQVLFSRFGFSCVNDTDTGYLFRRGSRFVYAPDLKYRMKQYI
jgi:ribosomal protein S18 acetylase RimI-like enzyme